MREEEKRLYSRERERERESYSSSDIYHILWVVSMVVCDFFRELRRFSAQRSGADRMLPMDLAR